MSLQTPITYNEHVTCFFSSSIFCMLVIVYKFLLSMRIIYKIKLIIMNIHNTFCLKVGFLMVFMGFPIGHYLICCHYVKVFLIRRGKIRTMYDVIVPIFKRNSTLVPFWAYLINYLPTMGNNELKTQVLIHFCHWAILPLLTWSMSKVIRGNCLWRSIYR
jgi:hypothetical protein